MKIEMRRKDKQLSIINTEKIIESGEYGILSMVTEKNEPYAIPLNYIYWDGNIYIHCAKKGNKLDIIRKNNKVSFTVVRNTKILPKEITTKYESAIVNGAADEVAGDEKYEALIKFLEKYSSEFMVEGKIYLNKVINQTVVVKIDINEITGKQGKG